MVINILFICVSELKNTIESQVNELKSQIESKCVMQWAGKGPLPYSRRRYGRVNMFIIIINLNTWCSCAKVIVTTMFHNPDTITPPPPTHSDKKKNTKVSFGNRIKRAQTFL